MTNPSPEATLLLQKYTNVQIAEKVVELEADNAALQKQVEGLWKALHDEYIISPGHTLCKNCGCDWALGAPHEHHDEECPLYREDEDYYWLRKALEGAELNDD